MVQHVGCWLLLALANEFGLHADACYAFTLAAASSCGAADRDRSGAVLPSIVVPADES